MYDRVRWGLWLGRCGVMTVVAALGGPRGRHVVTYMYIRHVVFIFSRNCAKLVSVGLLQQDIKLVWPYSDYSRDEWCAK